MNRENQLTQLQRKDANSQRIRSAKRHFRKKDARSLLRKLKTHTVEKDVENAWREAFSNYYIDNSNGKMKMNSPEKCDGFISPSRSEISLYDSNNSNTHKHLIIVNLRLLMEFKQQAAYKKMGGGNLTLNKNRVMITIQILHYMKKMEKDNILLPNVMVGADENEAFVLLASRFYKYLNGNYNWNCSPSSAWKDDPKLFKDLSTDANMNIFPFQFNIGNFNQKYQSLLDFFMTIDTIGYKSENYQIPINPSNILDLYDQFCNVAYRGKQHISSVDSVNIFMQLITKGNRNEYYLLPADHNKFHLPGDKIINVYGNQIDAFLNKYDRNLKPNQIDELTGIADRLIKAEQRRFKGDFWTPDIWASKANNLMENIIDPNYRQNSLIWDPAAGVRNLTRQFNDYSDLFISTYHKSEILLGQGYNPECKAAFQYDFLNDDVKLNPTDNPKSTTWKMPKSLFNELKHAGKTGKRVIFYTNPPFGTANNENGTTKKDIASTVVNELMKQDGYGAASQQLYAQFFYRVLKLIKDFKLTNVYISFFTTATLFSGGKYWRKFNHKIFSRLKFIKGMLISSKEFSGTSGTWPVAFSIYKLRPKEFTDKNVLDHLKFKFSVYKSDLDNNKHLLIHKLGNHVIASIYGKNSLSYWAKEPLKTYSKYDNEFKGDYPELSSAMTVSNGKSPRGVLYKDSLGYMVINSNNVAENQNGVWIVSSAAYKGSGMNIMPVKKNFNRAIIAFTARRCINSNSLKHYWIYNQDNYKSPDNNNNVNKIDFVNDCLIYSLFNNTSYQAAYRNRKWTNINIPGHWANKWFWLSNNYVTNIANDNHNLLVYNDAKTGHNSYIYNQIQKRHFTVEAKNVLKDATQVWNDTFNLRSIISNDNPDLYLNAWDAGWYQLKQIPQTKHLESYKQFQKDYKILNNKLVFYIYKLHILRV